MKCCDIGWSKFRDVPGLVPVPCDGDWPREVTVAGPVERPARKADPEPSPLSEGIHQWPSDKPRGGHVVRGAVWRCVSRNATRLFWRELEMEAAREQEALLLSELQDLGIEVKVNQQQYIDNRKCLLVFFSLTFSSLSFSVLQVGRELNLTAEDLANEWVSFSQNDRCSLDAPSIEKFSMQVKKNIVNSSYLYIFPRSNIVTRLPSLPAAASPASKPRPLLWKCTTRSRCICYCKTSLVCWTQMINLSLVVWKR